VRVSKWTTPAAGVLSGLLFSFAFPPLQWVLLLPLALVPWLIALTREEGRGKALLSGVLFGLAYWCTSIPWIFYVVTRFGGQNDVMGVVCLVASALILAPCPAVVAWATVACGPSGSVRRLALFPILWMASEHGRSFVLRGFPWNLTGHALYRHPIWMQSAALWGVFGVGALVAAISSLLALAILRRRARPALAAVAIVLAAGAGGAVRLARPEKRGADASAAISVALLQPNVSQEARLRDSEGEAYRRVFDQGRRAAQDRPSLIVIPESALPAYWDRSPLLRRDLLEIARNSEVLFNDIEELPDGRYYNVARLIDARGPVGQPYRKVHLVPFGEYVPLAKLFFFVRQVSTEIGEFSAAEQPTVLAGSRVRIGMGVCFEILYPGLIRKEVGELRANLLVTISNDSWYGRAGAQEQHFAGAVLRSVETNRYLLRAAITGISGIVDEKGRIRGELPGGEAGILRGTARLLDRNTVWTRWGYWFPRAADVLSAAVLVFGLVRWRRSRPNSQSTADERPQA
jgi:apolipoprotein N-acyltransferase